MCATISLNIDHIPAADVLVNFARMFTSLKGFCRWAVVLSMSFLAVFRALRHSPYSPARDSTHYNVFRLNLLLQILVRSFDKSPYTFVEERLDNLYERLDMLAMRPMPSASAV